MATASTTGEAFAELLDAAEDLIVNLIDTKDFGPNEENPDYDDYPKDEDGDAWYHDAFRLREAVNKARKLIG